MGDCIECHKPIPIGYIVKQTPDGDICEECLGIQTKAEDYRVFWNGRIVPLSEVPSWARQMFWGHIM